MARQINALFASVTKEEASAIETRCTETLKSLVIKKALIKREK